MSQYGYTYGAPGGYHPSQPDRPPGNPYAAYNGTTASHPIEADVQPVQVSQHAYDHNHNTIPGLNFGHPEPPANPEHVNSQFHNQVPGLGSSLTSTSVAQAHSQDDANNYSHLPDEEKDVGGEVAGDSELEEGELSEGELEDAYDPRHPQIEPSHPGRGRAYSVSRRSFSDRPPAANTYNAYSRGPGGSLLPHHSPRDKHVARPRGSSKERTLANPPVSIPSTLPSFPDETTPRIPQPISVATARKDAKDAILRLWPLNVRFNDYLHEGIDRNLLLSLFRDLGLNIEVPEVPEVPAPASPASTAMSLDNTAPTPKDTPVIPPIDEQASQIEPAADTPLELPAQLLAELPTVMPATLPAKPVEVPATAPAAEAPAKAPADPKPDAPNDKPAEERKDRIARLLAKQGSKQSAPAPEPKPSEPATSPTPSSNMTKSLSEKSKLIFQKIEALRKQRESQVQTPAQLSENTSAEEPATTPIPTMPELSSGSQSQRPALERNGSLQSNTSVSKAVASPNHQQPPIVVSSLPKRPAASDLDDTATATTKRPFGQIRQPEPFLIDVSDDDDDEAMDIDSPELETASLQRPSSPFRIPSLHSFSTSSNTAIPRPFSTPGPLKTPPIGTGSGLSRGNLETMNKEIEQMKQRIAEAEARKRARLSRTGSPLGQLPGASAADPTPLSIPSTATSESNFVGSPARSLVDVPSQKLPKLSDMSDSNRAARSRSRAASERLPLIEAYRKEKLLKLEALRSQIANIEKEIEENMNEEKTLRLDVLEGKSDNDEDSALANTEPASSEGAAPMETDSESSSGEMEVDKPELPAGSEPLAGPTSDQSQASLQQPALNNESAILQTSGLGRAIASRQIPTSANEPDQDSMVPDRPLEVEDNAQAVSNAASPLGSAEASDDYEPPEAESSSAGEISDDSFSPAPTTEHAALGVKGDAPQAIALATPIVEPISTGKEDEEAAWTLAREERATEPVAKPRQLKAGFIPYESPLSYFRAYRFHPRYQDAVSGGLRSLTYSNKIDVKQQLCPDQLAGHECPRGKQCDFQHFESFEIPDDQILMQLGIYDGDGRQEYITGLRQLLTDYRERKIKDFKTISQGILDYRAQFRGDKTKILPLGNVSL